MLTNPKPASLSVTSPSDSLWVTSHRDSMTSQLCVCAHQEAAGQISSGTAVFGLQCTGEAPCADITALAKHYLKVSDLTGAMPSADSSFIRIFNDSLFVTLFLCCDFHVPLYFPCLIL